MTSKVFLGGITIKDYLDEEGHHSYSVDINGDLQVVHALGLLRLAEHHVLEDLMDEEDDEDE